MDDCLVAVVVAGARPPPDEYETDLGDNFSDREDEDIAPVSVSRSGRPIRAHFRLDFLNALIFFNLFFYLFHFHCSS